MLVAAVEALRVRQGLTQSRMAREMGISREAWKRAKAGRPIGIRLLAAIRQRFPGLAGEVDCFLADYPVRRTK